MPIDEKRIGELAEEYQVTSEDLDTETPEEPLYDPETSPEVTPDEEWSVNPQWGQENIEEVNEIMTEGKAPAEVKDQSGCFIGSVMSCSPQEVKTKLEKGEIDEEEATDYYLKKAIEKDLFKMEPNEIKMAHMRGLIDDEAALKYINYKKHPVGYTIADMAKGIGYGVRNAAYEFNQALVSLYNWATGDDFDPTKSTGIMGSIFYTGTEEDAQAETTVGGITSTLSQFGVGFVPAMKGVQALKAIPTLARMAKAAPRAYRIVEAAVAGAPVDTLLFDPKEPRLADFLSKYEVLRNPVFEYLKSSPDDTESEARLKNMIEGMGMGVMFDGLFLGLKVIKGKLWAKHANRADKVAEELHRNIPDDLQGKPPKKEEAFVLEDLGEQRVDI